jgi:hypothetical protein
MLLHVVLFSGLCVNLAMSSHSAANLMNFSDDGFITPSPWHDLRMTYRPYSQGVERFHTKKIYLLPRPEQTPRRSGILPRAETTLPEVPDSPFYHPQ